LFCLIRLIYLFFSYELSDQLITQLLDILFKEFKNVSLQLEPSELSEIGKEFSNVQIRLFKEIAEKVDAFTQDNVFAYLYELERDSSPLHKLFVIHDIFMSKENVQTLEKFNDTDQFNALLENKLSPFEQSLYLNNFQASIVEKLLENFYLNPIYKDHLHFDLSSSLLTSSMPFDIVSIVRTLVINLYHFERFLNFYFSHDTNFSKQKELLNILKSLRTKIESILNAIKTKLKTSSKSNNNSSLIQFIRFLISCSNSEEILGLSYANFVVNSFYPDIHWMDILNNFGYLFILINCSFKVYLFLNS